MALRGASAPPAVFAAGWARPRNFAHNVYPFRAESHFLYLVGRHIEGALLVLDRGDATLFVDPPDPGSMLWVGPLPSIEEWGSELGMRVMPLSEFSIAGDSACLPPQDEETAQWLSLLLDRAVEAQSGPSLDGADHELAKQMVECRLRHDDFSVQQLRYAAKRSAEAHRIAMRRTLAARTEAEIRGAVDGALIAAGLSPSYHSIVTTRGEILHATESCGALHPGQLLLCDAGGETREGQTADITRTWPVSGVFSPTQRVIYDAVLRVQRNAIERVCAGIDFTELHLGAAFDLAADLSEIGLLHGSPEELVEKGALSVFFPHGLGHLLGLDVHDMEDLGDLAGYGPDAQRSTHPARSTLRLRRKLEVGMCVTVEPGFYQVPFLLNQARADENVRPLINWEALSRFSDVRGIRIEDDVLVTETGRDVLSEAVPKDASEIEQLLIQPE
jgi:Xaa-Pro aminopeptidase